VILTSGCYSTSHQRANPAVAPPLPVPAPIGPGQAPPVQQPPPAQQQVPGQPQIPLPPGSTPGPTAVVPASPDQGRAQAIAQRLYQANPWVKLKPVWIVQPGDVPGVAPQGEQYVILSEGLVRSASDGQLAAVMALTLADLASH